MCVCISHIVSQKDFLPSRFVVQWLEWYPLHSVSLGIKSWWNHVFIYQALNVVVIWWSCLHRCWEGFRSKIVKIFDCLIQVSSTSGLSVAQLQKLCSIRGLDSSLHSGMWPKAVIHPPPVCWGHKMVLQGTSEHYLRTERNLAGIYFRSLWLCFLRALA